MRILLINKFYRRAGGDCVHFLAVERLLRGAGHEVAVMTMRHPDNLPLPPGSYELPQVRIDGPLAHKLKAAARILGAGIDRAVSAALREFRPEVVHLHNIHSYISPRVAQLAHSAGCRVVWTLHDYKLLCPAYAFQCRGEVCTRCLSSPRGVLSRRCMKSSVAASFLAYAEARRWRRAVVEPWVDAFICPSGFMREQMIAGAWPAHKLITLGNFMGGDAAPAVSGDRSGACYIGRLSPEKGVDRLARVAARSSWRLTIAGSGPQEQDLRRQYGGCPNIEFAGALDAAGVAALLGRSAVSVVPSVCFENNPLAAIESLCCGTPVVGTRIGGIPELITPDAGLLCAPGDDDALGRAVTQALALPWDNAAIAAGATARFAPAPYLQSLLNIYSGTKSAPIG